MVDTQLQTSTSLWFDDFIATLRTHELQLNTGTADSSTENFYSLLLRGDFDRLSVYARSNAQKHFISQIILDYINMVKENLPLKLAFDFSDSEVLVWAEIRDDDQEMERHLLRSEAAINSKYHEFGFDMETTIVESGDGLAIPNHYNIFRS